MKCHAIAGHHRGEREGLPFRAEQDAGRHRAVRAATGSTGDVELIVS
jgi:hypothetical protein